jgi:hypothetical protein
MAAVRVGQAESAGVEAELSSGAVPITVVLKADGGTVHGTVEKCESGLVVLVAQDPALQTRGFLRDVRCDPNDRYEIVAVRPGGYYALAFAGRGSVPQLDEGMLRQANRVTIRAGEASSIDLHVMRRPGY